MSRLLRSPSRKIQDSSRMPRIPVSGGVVDIEEIKRDLNDVSASKSAGQSPEDDQSQLSSPWVGTDDAANRFVKVERQEVDFKGFSSYMVKLKHCLIDDQVAQLKKRLQ